MFIKHEQNNQIQPGKYVTYMYKQQRIGNGKQYVIIKKYIKSLGIIYLSSNPCVM